MVMKVAEKMKVEMEQFIGIKWRTVAERMLHMRSMMGRKVKEGVTRTHSYKM